LKYKRNFYEIKSNEEIFSNLLKEKEYIGYYSLPFQDISKIVEYSQFIEQKNIVVVGIGGSTLGTKAIYKFLKTSKSFTKNLYFIDTIDPLEVNFLLSNVELSNSHFIVISKSGNTIEPISIIKYIDSKIKIDKGNSTVITGKETPLHKFALNNHIPVFFLDENIGGRFSVFSPVGLLPLAIIGVDIKKLLEGCREVHESFFQKKYFYDHIINKARFLVENKSRFVINIIFSYSSVFSDFNKWYVQLWAESLGKKNTNGTRQGITPIALLGPDDQHSFLQLIMDGVRNKTVTFFKIENLRDKSKIPNNKKFEIFNIDYTNDKSLNDLINLQADATYEAVIREKDIPCDIITISSVNEKNIAKLMYRFQLLTSCVGSFLQVNTYDQPGVELGKEILKASLNEK